MKQYKNKRTDTSERYNKERMNLMKQLKRASRMNGKLKNNTKYKIDQLLPTIIPTPDNSIYASHPNSNSQLMRFPI